MAVETIHPVKSLSGTPVIPGDKSVSHRSLLFGALSKGRTEIENLLNSGDVNSTARCLTQLGIKITHEGGKVFVEGAGGFRFAQPSGILDCENSGTTIRLLMGILAGQKMTATLTGDASLVKRPMKRIADPLILMGADIELSSKNFAPLTIRGKPLKGIRYSLPVASAQLKTAVTLAGLNAEGVTEITGEIHSRDHTERMLKHFGVKISSNEECVRVEGGQTLTAARVRVPGDPSTAAFWLGAACLVPGARITMNHVSTNPSRTGFAECLAQMGGALKVKETEKDPEPMGTVTVEYGRLKGVHVTAQMVPSLIDELPLLAVIATQAHGKTIVEGAEELRVKESDRIEAMAKNLRAMGAVVETRPDGFIIEGPQKLKGTDIESFHDHRIAMAFSIAGLIAEGSTRVHDAECVGISYPAFYKTLKDLCR